MTELTDALTGSGIATSQVPADPSNFQMPGGPDDDIGQIQMVNAREEVTPFVVNLNETVSNAVARATNGTRSDRFDLTLKNGTVLAPNMTLRDAGVQLDEAFNLVERDSGVGTMSPPPGSAMDIANHDDLKEVIVNRENGEVFKTHVRDYNTVDDVIRKITKDQDNEEFQLIANGRALPRNTSIANVRANTSSLSLKENPVEVFVRTAEGGNVTLRLRRSDTVLRLKERFRDQRQVETHQLRLQYQSKPLEDTKTLKSYGIRNGSSIESTYRLRGGN